MNCFGAAQNTAATAAAAASPPLPPHPTPHSLPVSPPQTPDTPTSPRHAHRPKYHRKSSLSSFLGSLLPSASSNRSSRPLSSSRSRPPSPPSSPPNRRSWAPGHRPNISQPLPLSAYPFDSDCELSRQLRAAFDDQPSALTPSLTSSPPSKDIADSPAVDRAAMSTNSMLLHPAAASTGRGKQIKSAQDTGKKVIERAKKAGITPPPYEFLELIGKGSFGRVYKCRRKVRQDLVAVKVIDVDSQDYKLAPSEKDQAIKDFLIEIQILQALKDSKAKNINTIHEAFNFHSQLWIVSEYCPGGSVHTLMKASSKPGLEEKYIIAISRELAVALKHVHEAGIIHRDVKAANVLITQDGQLQLCDFGVSGVLESNVAKRSTIIGTPFWMAPELHEEAGVGGGYGTEVDCWAFGCTVYELATGQPPNANIAPHRLHLFLQKAPRLEGGEYSPALREFASFCLEERPQERPSAEKILKHPYIANSSKRYPTIILRQLIDRFATWESAGGQRASLFQPHGASAPTATDPFSADDNDEWNFSTTDDFAEELQTRQIPRTPDMVIHDQSDEETPKQRKSSKKLTPFEKAQQEQRATRGARKMARLFDENAEPYEYNLEQEEEEATEPYSDLPFRRGSAARAADRETIIDLDAARVSQDLSSATNLDLAGAETIRANKQRFRFLDDFDDEEDDNDDTSNAGKGTKRFTRDWKFPAQAQASRPRTLEWTMAQAMTQSSSVDASTEESSPTTTDSAAPRPTLKHTVTEPLGTIGDFIHPSEEDEADDNLKIDLDEAGMSNLQRQASFASSISTEFDNNPFYHDDDPDLQSFLSLQDPIDFEEANVAADQDSLAPENQDTLRAKRNERTSLHWYSQSEPNVPDRTSGDSSGHHRAGSLSSDTEFERHQRNELNNDAAADTSKLPRSVSSVSLSGTDERPDPKSSWKNKALAGLSGEDREESEFDTSRLLSRKRFGPAVTGVPMASDDDDDDDGSNYPLTDIDISEVEHRLETQRRTTREPSSRGKEQAVAPVSTARLEPANAQVNRDLSEISNVSSGQPSNHAARRVIDNATAANAAAALSLADSQSRYQQQSQPDVLSNLPRSLRHRRGRRGRPGGSTATTATTASNEADSERAYLQRRATRIMQQFPPVRPVDAAALEEDADPETMEAELGRLLDGFLDGLNVAKALMQHVDGGVYAAGSGSGGSHGAPGGLTYGRSGDDIENSTEGE